MAYFLKLGDGILLPSNRVMAFFLGDRMVVYFSDRVVAYFSGESSTGAAAIAPQRRDSPSITRRGVFLFLFFPSWQDQKICVTGFIFSSQTENIAFGSARPLILSLADSCQT